MSIKVGQIRKRDKFIFVVTNVYGTFFGDRAYIIYTQGDAETLDCGYIDDNSGLIAEYPTWQEAVNSKEFKGSEK